MVIRPNAIPALAAGIVLLLAGGGRAESYRDEGRHFTLELPEGWGQMPSETLAAANASGRDLAGPYYSRYTAGFQRTSHARAGSPIILVQFEPSRFDRMS